MTETPLGASAPGASAAPGQPDGSGLPVPDKEAQESRTAARIEQALAEMRTSGERLQLGMRRSARLAGLAGGAALALVALSAGIWVRSAAHLAAASEVQNAAASALVDRIVRLEALAGRIETAQQATGEAGPEMLNRFSALQENLDAGLGTLRQGFASLRQDIASDSARSAEAVETRVLAAIADVGIAVAGLRAGTSVPATQPMELAALVARLEAAVAAVERDAKPAPAPTAKPTGSPAPAQRAARPQRPTAPNPFSFP